MKKVLVTLVVLALALPAWATVNISCTTDGNQVTVNYQVVSEPNKVSGFGLDISVDNGAKITSISNLNSKYWVYPGSIIIINGEVNDVGTPIGDPAKFPGTLGGLNTSGITIEMGALYYPAGDNSPNAPPLSGTLLKFRVDKDCTVTIAENTVRGGVVLTNPSVDPTVTATGCIVTSTPPDCFPSNYTSFNDWKTMGRPDCWCGTLVPAPRTKWPYQCDGDADNKTSGAPYNYRIFTGDLGLIISNWKKKISDYPATLNPCADIDHKSSGAPYNYRVFTGDLGVIIANWKKKDTQLPANCPRGI